jgi:O-antigen ligase
MRASAPHLIATVLFFVTVLAGRYSTGPRGDTSPPFLDSLTTEVRYPCFALLLMALVIAARRSRPSEFAGPNTRAWIASVIALHLYIALSALWSNALDGQVLYRVSEATQLIALILIADWLFRVAPGPTGTIFFTLCFGAGLLYAFGGATGQWNPIGQPERAAAFGGGSNIFARVVGTGLLASLYLWGKSGSWWWIAASPVLFISAVLSGSRGAMLGLLAAVALLTAFVLRHNRRVWSGLAVIAAAAFVLAPFLGDRLGTFWTERYVELTFEERYLSSRDSLFTSAWDLFCRHPVVGAGLNGFQQATGDVYPHNLILNVASEGGVIGLMFLTLPFLFVIARCFRPMTLEQKAALSAGLFYFIASMFSGTYYDARFMWVFFVILMQPGGGSKAFRRGSRPQPSTGEILVGARTVTPPVA